MVENISDHHHSHFFAPEVSPNDKSNQAVGSNPVQEIDAALLKQLEGVKPKKAISRDSTTLGKLTSRLSELKNAAVSNVKSALRQFKNLVSGRSAPKEIPPLTPSELEDVQKQLELEELQRQLESELAGIGQNVEIDDLKDVPDRTRYDFVAYANQISVAGTVALDSTVAQLDSALKGAGIPGSRDMRDNLQGEYIDGIKSFQNLIHGLEKRPAFSGVSEDVLKYLDSDNESVARGARHILTQALRKPVSASEKLLIEHAEAEIHHVEEECVQQCRSIINSVRMEAREKAANDPHSAPKLAQLEKELDKIEKSLSTAIGDVRRDIIHARKEWNTESATEYQVELKSKDGTETEWVSSFKAAGPPYSSVLGRTRLKEDTVIPNFFETTLEGADGNKAISRVTRSAIPVEFGLDDPELRAESTRQNIKQVLDHHTLELVKGMEPTDNVIGTKDSPVVLKYQHLMLMTPDMLRRLGGAHQKIVYRADNERLLVNESLEANKYWNNQTKDEPIEVTVEVNGQPTKVWVKYDIRTFNIPSNTYQEASTSNILKKLNVRHSLTDNCNVDGLESFKKDIEDLAPKQSARISELKQNLGEGEAGKLQEIQNLAEDKRRLRKSMSNYVFREKPIPKELLQQWQGVADSLNVQIKAASNNASDELKETLTIVQQMETINDLFMDLNELITQKAYKNPDMLDGNRYAIGSRILYLGEMLDLASHFGCRSGKDRTGIQDDEFKLLVSESLIDGRVPSYLEVEASQVHQENRSAMMHQSGNAEFNPRANLGGFAWWNVGGARLTPKGEFLGAQRKSEYDGLQAMSKLFQRPKTSGYRRPQPPAAQRSPLRNSSDESSSFVSEA